MRVHEGLSLKLEGKRLDDWQVEDYIAEGAFGIVHRGRHVQTGDLAALKIMKPELVTLKRLERFQREGIALRRMQHPNVVQYLGGGRAEVVGTGVFYMALELLEGVTLEQELAQRGRLPEKMALWIVSEIVHALLAVEQHRIVHGDLKPSNVFLTSEGRAKVMDFGHSTLLEFDNLTRQGAFVGTAPFAAPEQFVDSSQVDGRADQYSLGCLLYNMLTGSVPFPDAQSLEAQSEAHQQHLTVPVRRRNPQVTAFAQALTNRLMAKRKQDRFARLQDIAALLTTREASNFFHTLLPDQHHRRDSAVFWTGAVFPRYPQPRCPQGTLTEPAVTLARMREKLCQGEGGLLLVQGDRGTGITRAVYETFHQSSAVQLVRGRMHYEGELAFTPVLNLLEGLFPHHKHPKFAWEEQFRFLTGKPPDQYSTLRILLKDPAGYLANFSADRDVRLAGELVMVLGALGRDLPLAIVWDHCEQYDPRLVSLLMRLLPRLAREPVLNICTGPRITTNGPTASAGWTALLRGLPRLDRTAVQVEVPPPDPAQISRVLGLLAGDEGDLRLLLKSALGYTFPSWHQLFTWLAYWKETLHARRMQLGRAQLATGSYAGLRDPLIGGSPDALYAGRWQHLDPSLRRTLTVLAEEGEFFEFPRPDHYRDRVNQLDIYRFLMDLERRWHLVLYREHGQFRDPGFVDWIRRNPQGR